MSLLNLLLLLSLIGAFWYRISGAKSDADYGRIRAMFRYVSVAVLIIPAGYTVLWIQGVPMDLEALSFNLLLLLLAAVLVPYFDVRVVAAVGTLIVLLDPNNTLSTSLFILPAFVIPVVFGAILGAWLFRISFRKKLRAATESERHPAGG